MNQQQTTLIGFGIVAIVCALGFFGLRRELIKANRDVNKTLQNMPKDLLKQVGVVR